jgi:hypothetical protein
MVFLFPVAPILSLLNPFLSDINWEMVVVLFSAWDYSAWVRLYALFLEERLECYHVLKYGIEMERLVSSPLHLRFSMYVLHYWKSLCLCVYFELIRNN